jgi:hypothetical protein
VERLSEFEAAQPIVVTPLHEEVLALPQDNAQANLELALSQRLGGAFNNRLIELLPFVRTTQNTPLFSPQEIATVAQTLRQGTVEERAAFFRRHYPEIVRWLRREYSRLCESLGDSGVQQQPRAPIPLAPLPGHPGVRVSPELNQALIAAGRLSIDLPTSPAVILGNDDQAARTQLTQFQNALESVGRFRVLDFYYNGVGTAQRFHHLFREYGCEHLRPPTDIRRVGDWILAADLFYTTMHRVSQCADAIHVFSNQQNTGQFFRTALSELRALGVEYDSDAGTISFRNALPAPRDGTTFDYTRLQALQSWLGQYAPRVQELCQSLRRHYDRVREANPALSPYLHYGHEERQGQRSVNGTLENYNFVEHSFTAQRRGDRVYITQTNRYMARNGVLSPHNFNARQIGPTEQVPEYSVGLNDWLPVVDHQGRARLIRGAAVPRFLREEAFLFDLHRYGGLALDVGLIVSGGIAARGALAAGRGTIALLNLGRAGAGMAQLYRHDLPPSLVSAADWAIALDMTGLATSRRYREFNEMVVRTSALAGSSQAQAGTLFGSMLRRGAVAAEHAPHTVMFGGGIATSPVILENIYTNVRNQVAGPTNSPPEAFDRIFGFNNLLPREQQGPVFNRQDPRTAERTVAIFSDYVRTLSNPPELQRMLERVRELMGADVQARRNYCNELLQQHFRCDGAAISRALRDRRSNTLNQEEINSEFWRRNAGPPTNIQTAAAVAILLLSAGENARAPDIVANTSIQIPGYNYVIPGRRIRRGTFTPDQTIQVPLRTANQELRRDDLLAFLRRSLDPDRPPSMQQIIAAEACWQQGDPNVRDFRLASVYCAAIRSNDPALGMRALLGAPNSVNFGILIHELRVREASATPEQRALAAQHGFGLRSSELLEFLRTNLPPTDNNNRDRRAAMLATSYALDTALGPPDLGLLNRLSVLWQQHRGQSGAFATALYADRLAELRRGPAIPIPGLTLGTPLATAADTASSVARSVDAAHAVQGQLRNALFLHAAGRLNGADTNAFVLRSLNARDPQIARIALANLDFSSLTIQQRRQVLSVLTGSVATEANEILKLEVLHRLPQLLLLPDGARPPSQEIRNLRNSAVSMLCDMLDDQNQLFSVSAARPLVRIAALTALANLGRASDPRTIAVIREALARERGQFVEDDAGVRYAAVAALDRLRPANTLNILAPVLQHETDSAVQARARSLQRELEAQRPPDPIRLRREFDARSAQMGVRDNRYTALGRQFLDTHFPALSWAHYDANAALIFGEEPSPSSFDGRNVLGAFDALVHWEPNRASRLMRERVAQLRNNYAQSFTDLLRIASGNASEPENARMQRRIGDTQYTAQRLAISAIGFLMTTQLERIRPIDRDRALGLFAEFLEDMSRPDTVRRSDVADLVIHLLTTERELHPHVEYRLLRALISMTEPNAIANTTLQHNPPLVSRELAQRVITQVLWKRIASTNPNHIGGGGSLPERTEPLYRDVETIQRLCIRLLTGPFKSRDPEITGILQAIGTNLVRNNRLSPTVVAEANVAFHYLVHGTLYWYSDALQTPNRDPSLTNRLGLIVEAQANPGQNDDNVVRAIHRATTGLTEAVPANAPLVTALVRIMHSYPTNQRLQLTAAFALLNLSMQNGDAIKDQAKRVLADLSIFADLEGHRDEARVFLARYVPNQQQRDRLLEEARNSSNGINWIYTIVQDGVTCCPPSVNRERDAASISRALQTFRLSSEDPAETICRACLGTPFIPNDPRLPALVRALIHQDHRIQLIAARLLLENAPNSHGILALESLSAIYGAEHSLVREEPMRQETLELLNRSLDRMLSSNNNTISQATRREALAFAAHLTIHGNIALPREDTAFRQAARAALLRNLPNGTRTVETSPGHTVTITRNNGEISFVQTWNGDVTNVLLPNGGRRRYVYIGGQLSEYITETGARWEVIGRNGNQLTWSNPGRTQEFVSPTTITPATALQHGIQFRISRQVYGDRFRAFRHDGDTLVYLNENGTVYERIRDNGAYTDLWRVNGSNDNLWTGPMSVTNDGTFTEYRLADRANRTASPDGTVRYGNAVTQTLRLPGGRELTVYADGRCIVRHNGQIRNDFNIRLSPTYVLDQFAGGASVLYNHTTDRLGIRQIEAITYPEGSEILYRRFQYTDGVLTSMTFQRAGASGPTTVTREGNNYREVGPGVNRVYQGGHMEFNSDGSFIWTRGSPDYLIETHDTETGRIRLRSSF